MNDTIKIVCEALEDIGICADFDISDLLINDLDLRDYIPDSIIYIFISLYLWKIRWGSFSRIRQLFSSR